MSKYIVLAIACWVAVASLIAVILTSVDKKRAIRSRWRIPEATLLLFGFLGGAMAEYLMMKKIRHKTKHKRFMVGLPLMVVLHIALIGVAVYAFVIPH